ncbi:short neuropeptide F isoform X1 [Bombyx mori]|uniref:Short neuropeptide F n=1 Tax=Bombyx mori TaxID=7091 RepID=B3XXL1_BOMMO|nr:short neuropeptide F precursor [Bombyx mori]XP_037868614.1 short neuropeptide F isoform X1 [Bombyx mori]ADW08938.1 short neuropeptide F precursor [Bombyx mori]BAG68397.1 short neuropeptide F [Bombyx mori]
MSRSFVFALALFGMVAVLPLPAANAQALSNYDASPATFESRNNWDALGGLYALLAQHDALGGHALARKSVRSPSRRLRFGRRSDPDMPPQAPIDEMDELLSLREVRTPVRLRFGRRSDERAVPHIFPQEEQDRAVRAPSMRLRFGRRSDNNMFLMPYESALPKEVKASGSVEDDRQQE